MTSIPETLSQQPRRGRPPNQRLADEVSFFEQMGCCINIHSRRGKQDVAYRQRAVAALISHVDALAFRWLADEARMMAGKRNAWQPTILAELGRIHDRDAMIDLARQLGDMAPHPTVRDAVAMVRRWRTGSQPQADPKQLAVAICNIIDRNVSGHSGITKDLLISALEMARQTIEETEN